MALKIYSQNSFQFFFEILSIYYFGKKSYFQKFIYFIFYFAFKMSLQPDENHVFNVNNITLAWCADEKTKLCDDSEKFKCEILTNRGSFHFYVDTKEECKSFLNNVKAKIEKANGQ